MTENERKSLAEQMMANPLFAVVLGELEASAIERLVYATDDISRHECQLRVQAVRSFRSDLVETLSTREPKGAPA